MLRGSAADPSLLAPRDTPGLIDALRAAGVFDAAAASRLHAAHATLLDAGLACTLDRRARIVAPDADVAAARAVIASASAAFAPPGVLDR